MHTLPKLTPWLTAIVTLLGALPLVADDALTVRVRSGRTFGGRLDARTTASQLWVRTDREGVTIARPLAWESVVEVRNDQRPVDRDELLAQAAKLQDDVAPVKPKANTTKHGSLQLWRPAAGLVSETTAAPVQTVQWIEVDGYLANWDADVEADGLLLDLQLFDRFGEPAAVGGTLAVELIGETVPPYSRGNAAPMLARWTRQLTPADFTGGRVRLPLEFQAVHPDFMRTSGRFALIHCAFHRAGTRNV
ncbi:MAG: hypothetical protein QM775_26135 [Pirellulales bacterium]